MSGRKRSYSINTPFKKPRTMSVSVPKQIVYRPSTGELKNIDFSNQTAMGTAATGVAQGLVNGIAQGVGSSERVGRRVTMTSMWVRWNFTMQATSTGASPLRILIVYDKQSSSGAQPSTVTVVSTDDICGFKNLDQEKRFVTLMDEYVPAIGTGGPQAVIGQRFFKMKNVVEFNGTTNGFASIASGAVWAWVWQNGNILTAGPAKNLQVRIRYSDL